MFNSIRGEYWIQDGNVDFADGDVGDFNHEAIAINHVFYQYADDISSLAEELGIEDYEVDSYGELDIEKIQSLHRDILDALEEQGQQDPDQYFQQYIQAPEDAIDVMFWSGDARYYVMQHEGWIAVRGNNVELFGYDDYKRRNLIEGLSEIVHQEMGSDDQMQNLEFSIYDYKTGRSFDLSWGELNNPQSFFRQQQPNTNQGDRRFAYFPPDTTENTPTQQKSVPNPWKTAAQKAGIIKGSQDIWRINSETTFREWFLSF